MAHILSFGIAIPRRRLSGEQWHRAWGLPGEPARQARAVAGFDEDAFTLGAEAALDLLDNGLGKSAFPPEVDCLIFASTTAPFLERSPAALLAEVLGLPSGTRCMNLGSSLSCGVDALVLAADMVEKGLHEQVLVVAADKRTPEPGSPQEAVFGDGACALLVGGGGEALATIEQRARVSSAVPDSWRIDGERTVRSDDVRLARVHYALLVRRVLDELGKKAAGGGVAGEAGTAEGAATGGASTKPTGDAARPGPAKEAAPRPPEAPSLAGAIPYAPDPRSGMKLVRSLGLDPKRHYKDFVSMHAGLTGTAHVPLMMAAALERARPGERFLAVGYGDGAVAFHVVAGPKAGGGNRVAAALEKKVPMRSYTLYLEERGLVQRAPAEREVFTSEAMLTRERGRFLRLEADRCRGCGGIYYIMVKRCPRCGGVEFEARRLARRGKVFTYTREHYYPTPEPPLTMAVVDLEGGGRMTLQVADDDGCVEVGTPVELVLRKMHDALGHPNYFWKCRRVL